MSGFNNWEIDNRSIIWIDAKLFRQCVRENKEHAMREKKLSSSDKPVRSNAANGPSGQKAVARRDKAKYLQFHGGGEINKPATKTS